MDIGEKIKECRKEIGMSAEDLASIIGVSPSTIYRYENNDISNMGIDKLKAIASALHTYAYVLLGWEKDDNVTRDEMALIYKYRRLTSHSKELIDLILDKELEYCTTISDPSDKHASEVLKNINNSKIKSAL